MADVDLTTLTAVRAFMQTPAADTGQDDLVQAEITRASLACMRYLDRQVRPLDTVDAVRLVPLAGVRRPGRRDRVPRRVGERNEQHGRRGESDGDVHHPHPPVREYWLKDPGGGDAVRVGCQLGYVDSGRDGGADGVHDHPRFVYDPDIVECDGGVVGCPR